MTQPVRVLDAHSAMMLALIFDSRWYDKTFDKICLAAYDRYDGDKAWPAPLNRIPGKIGDLSDDIRLALTRHRAKKRLISNDIRSVK